MIDYDKILDYESFASNYLKVIHIENKKIVPFTIDRDTPLNTPIRRLNAIWKEDEKNGVPIRYIILKARREFFSTYIQSRMYHKISTQENRDGVIIAQDDDGVQKIFNIARIFYEETPDEIKPMKRYHNKREMRFENPDSKKRSSFPGLRSGINVYLAVKLG